MLKMKTTYKKREKVNKETNTRWFWQILGGEFLLLPKIRQWFPFILFLALLMGVILLSEREIVKKKQIIKEKEIEYKEEISKLKRNNKFIPYNQSQELILMLENEGFKKKDESMFKIIIED